MKDGKRGTKLRRRAKKRKTICIIIKKHVYLHHGCNVGKIIFPAENHAVEATPLDRGVRKKRNTTDRYTCRGLQANAWGRGRIVPTATQKMQKHNEAMNTNSTTDSEQHWYALRVFYNKVQPLIVDCKAAGLEFFAPVEIIKSLLFLRCSEEELWIFMAAHADGIYLYRLAGSRQPAVIRDREMEIFQFVVTAGQQGLTLLGDDRPEYHLGDRVVVTDGPFKGAEGHIKRIKKDRRLVVTIAGVVAVATTYIHPSLLKKVDAAE